MFIIVTYIIGGIFSLFVIIGIRFYLRHLIPLRKAEGGFEFVYVETDGTVRELYDDEVKYLSETFHPADSGRPYIKSSYTEKDGLGKISGYIRRRRVPKHITIK